MKIELSEHQYRKLVELVYLGNWMANSTKINEEEDKEYEEIEQYIFSYSKGIDMKNLIEFESKFKEYFPTRTFEESLDSIINSYDDFNFWQELSGRLAKRDLFREIGPVSKKPMIIEKDSLK
jgi:hypothetical protein